MSEVERLSTETQSPNKAKLDELKTILPGVFADGVIDAGRLSAEIGVPVVGGVANEEGFGLIWSGKKEAVAATQLKSMASLAPQVKESINWDSAKNVFIEGDNLEVLKLLQKAYNDQVKLIYIDPPYNTGNDFVYNDDFSDPVRHYLEVTGQLDDDGNRLRANTDTSGRKSSRWLSMMYPRLLLARNLLTDDGSIFVSIDDNEAAHLRELLDDIFGPENFLGQFIWAAGRKNDARYISTSHEYILVYARNIQSLNTNIGLWRKKKDGLEEIYKKVSEIRKQFGSDYLGSTTEMKQWFKSLDDSHPSKKHKHYSIIDARGVYFPDNIAKPEGGGGRYEVLHPITKKPVKLPATGWRYTSVDRMTELLADDRIHFGADEKTVPCVKRYLTDTENEVPYSVFYLDGRGASKRLTQLLEGPYFDFPKDENVLQQIVEFASDKDGIVLDFFAGSGTTGHSVLMQNAKDEGSRHFILVNIPEPTNEKSFAFKNGLTSVSEITRMRLRKVMESIPGAKDSGLRCLTLSPSNFIQLDLKDKQEEGLLFSKTIAMDVNVENIATEVLLKNGVKLDAAWKRQIVKTLEIVIADNVAVVVGLALDEESVEEILKLESLHTVVFLEDGFEGKDALKANTFFACKKSNVTMKTV
jgi:adenine-specific DNA-methyltransferase